MMTLVKLKEILINYGHRRVTIKEAIGEVVIYSRKPLREQTKQLIEDDTAFGVCLRYKKLKWYENIFRRVKIVTIEMGGREWES